MTVVAEQKLKVGLIVNPLAGVGGAVGLKGSDGAQTVAEAWRRGARPQAAQRAVEALQMLGGEPISWLTAAGSLGGDSAERAGLRWQALMSSPLRTSATDTRQLAARLLTAGIDLLVFAGGDGTARDIADVVGAQLPVLGIPAGCKMHSAVYAVNPQAAGRLLARLAQGGPIDLLDAVVRDIDEQAYRAGRLSTRDYGILRVPSDQALMQAAKQGGIQSESLALTELAAWAAEWLSDDRYWLIGAGSTVAEVMRQRQLENTLLGVDIVHQGRVIARDVGAAQLEALPPQAELSALIGVIGGQGHILGRGSQQFSAPLIRRLGREHLHLLATRSKLAALDGRPLLVDSGDAQLDQALVGLWPVTCGYQETVLVRVATDAEPAAGEDAQAGVVS